MSPRDIHGVGISVLHPILTDGPTAKAKEKEVVSPELTMQDGEQVASAGQRAEVAAKEKDKDTTPTPGVDTATVGVGPSSIVPTSPKLTPHVGGRDLQLVAGTGRTSLRTHLDEMLAQVVIDQHRCNRGRAKLGSGPRATRVGIANIGRIYSWWARFIFQFDETCRTMVVDVG